MTRRATIIRLKVLITQTKSLLGLLEKELQGIINAEEKKS